MSDKKKLHFITPEHAARDFNRENFNDQSSNFPYFMLVPFQEMLSLAKEVRTVAQAEMGANFMIGSGDPNGPMTLIRIPKESVSKIRESFEFLEHESIASYKAALENNHS